MAAILNITDTNIPRNAYLVLEHTNIQVGLVQVLHRGRGMFTPSLPILLLSFFDITVMNETVCVPTFVSCAVVYYVHYATNKINGMSNRIEVCDKPGVPQRS